MRALPTPFRVTAVAAIAALSLSACGSSTDKAEDAMKDTKASASAMADKADEAMDDKKDDAMTEKKDDAMKDDASTGATAMMPGAYLTQSEYESQMDKRADTKVVYFFNASWCPSCKATDSALNKTGVPDGLTVVKVDYDKATDLRKKYGVTTQHTFVQVDSSGKELAKWTGSADGAEIKGHTV